MGKYVVQLTIPKQSYVGVKYKYMKRQACWKTGTQSCESKVSKDTTTVWLPLFYGGFFVFRE